jgi:hypothetical protein
MISITLACPCTDYMIENCQVICRKTVATTSTYNSIVFSFRIRKALATNVDYMGSTATHH